MAKTKVEKATRSRVSLGVKPMDQDPTWLTIQDVNRKYGPGSARKFGSKLMAALVSIREDDPKRYSKALMMPDS